MRRQHSSISLENFVGGERFDKVVVQVATMRALLDVAVLGEILHSYSDVHHRLATVFAVKASLATGRRSQYIIGVHSAQLMPAPIPAGFALDADNFVDTFQAVHTDRIEVHESTL